METTDVKTILNGSGSGGFESRHLKVEEVNSAFVGALQQIDARRLQHHLNLAMNPDNQELIRDAAKAEDDLINVEEKFRLWKSCLSAKDRKKIETVTKT